MVVANPPSDVQTTASHDIRDRRRLAKSRRRVQPPA